MISSLQRHTQLVAPLRQTNLEFMTSVTATNQQRFYDKGHGDKPTAIYDKRRIAVIYLMTGKSHTVSEAERASASCCSRDWFRSAIVANAWPADSDAQ
jgi:hypothetical protein